MIAFSRGIEREGAAWDHLVGIETRQDMGKHAMFDLYIFCMVCVFSRGNEGTKGRNEYLLVKGDTGYWRGGAETKEMKRLRLVYDMIRLSRRGGTKYVLMRPLPYIIHVIDIDVVKEPGEDSTTTSPTQQVLKTFLPLPPPRQPNRCTASPSPRSSSTCARWHRTNEGRSVGINE